ncbi:hypothetical protein JAAARDRAFT_35119 [Jaapia argillacea MUCL 33604]|uniref:Uncharacterized protein n=1 Tax=Jaapia argillacea MUCL 33604 TaxID=933084 RepID=A0A067PRJ3_9AGAM|nr:hypothetical protein JAAARDRAFT_35119 [Jaapia argillacea MUCL 33604]
MGTVAPPRWIIVARTTFISQTSDQSSITAYDVSPRGRGMLPSFIASLVSTGSPIDAGLPRAPISLIRSHMMALRRSLVCPALIQTIARARGAVYHQKKLPRGVGLGASRSYTPSPIYSATRTFPLRQKSIPFVSAVQCSMHLASSMAYDVATPNHLCRYHFFSRVNVQTGSPLAERWESLQTTGTFQHRLWSRSSGIWPLDWRVAGGVQVSILPPSAEHFESS